MSAWGKVAIILGLFSAVFWPNLRRLWIKTNPFYGEANWGHAVCIPVIGIYYLYVHREELMRNPPRPFVWGPFFRRSRLGAATVMIAIGAAAASVNFLHHGSFNSAVIDLGITALQAVGITGVMVLALDWSLAITFCGIALYVYGIYPGQNDYIKDLGMVVTLFGVVLLICGGDIMRVAWFPIVFLICGIPWPGLVYSWVAGPLQQLAANTAVEVLKLTGVNASSSGTKIIMFGNGLTPPRTLNVAEACAGMRSLMTFITVGAAVGFLSSRAIWQKVIITFSAVPIAIFCNIMRVSGQGLLDHYVSPKLSESFAHQFVGMIMLIPAFFLILLVGVVLDQIFIEESDDRQHVPLVAAGAKLSHASIPSNPTPVAVPRSVSTAVQAAPVAVPPRPSTAVAPVRPPMNVPLRPAGVTPPRPTGMVPPPRPLMNRSPAPKPVNRPTGFKPPVIPPKKDAP